MRRETHRDDAATMDDGFRSAAAVLLSRLFTRALLNPSYEISLKGFFNHSRQYKGAGATTADFGGRADRPFSIANRRSALGKLD
jgi:hypothetical protein